tara:strand:- start:1609 stop:2277 length:669 start_codon:yes stop_codon:yes gene_type:complete
MPQQINKKILLYIFLFIILGTLNNKNFNKFSLPKIKNIKIYGLKTDNSSFAERLKLFKMHSLFFINKFEIKELFDSNSLIDEYKIFKVYPSSLEIKVIKAELLALTKIDGKNFFIGSNGKLIETIIDKQNLPFVFGDLNVEKFIELKRVIDKSNLDYLEIENFYFFPSGRWDLETKSGKLIKLPNYKLKEALELSLSLLDNEKFTNIKTIDVRQKNQVIINE